LDCRKGFTLIELLIVIAIIAVMATVVFVALNPLQRFQDARNAQRWQDAEAIGDAVRIYQIDNQGKLPTGIDETWHMLGTDTTGCGIFCAQSVANIELNYPSFSQPLNYYPLGTYTPRNWFDASDINDFSRVTVLAILDCDGVCSGNVRVRIGNVSSYTDYDLVDASSVRTDGTTSNYTWYSNVYDVDKSTLGDYFFVQILIYTGSGSMRFMMDELGPTGPDAEYRIRVNGDGSQTGWYNDNGDYFIKIDLETMDEVASTCLDLSSDLTTKLPKIPHDPSVGSLEKTYYAIQRDDSGQINVIACGAEGGSIKISR